MAQAGGGKDAGGSKKRNVPGSLRLGGSDDDEIQEKRLKVNPDNFKCSICLNIWHDVVVLTPCQHNFCNGCFSEWYKNCRGSCCCPECRVKVLYVGRNHAMRSVVDDLLTNDPSLKRPADEIDRLNKSALVTSNFMKLSELNKAPVRTPNHSVRGRLPAVLPRSIRTDVDDESDSEEDDEDDEETLEDRMFINDDDEGETAADEEEDEYRDEEDEEDLDYSVANCVQCAAGNGSSYTCPPGAYHLTCNGCGHMFPERTDISVQQACAGCSFNFCDIYFRSQGLPFTCPVKLQPVSERRMDALPPTTHQGNRVEQRFTEDYLTQRDMSISDVVRDWMAKVDNGEIALDRLPITSTSNVCDSCANAAMAQLMDKFRLSIPKSELSPAAGQRTDCWYGYACRTQRHKQSHAENYNHMCEPTSSRTQR